MIGLWLLMTRAIPNGGKHISALFRCQENIAEKAQKGHHSAKVICLKGRKRSEYCEIGSFRPTPAKTPQSWWGITPRQAARWVRRQGGKAVRRSLRVSGVATSVTK
jgi:hypothetical protein